MIRNILRIFASLIFVLVFFAVHSQIDTVRMLDNAFVPETLEIELGTTVVWINEDAALHTSTSGVDCTPDGTWASENMDQNDEFSYTFNLEGTFPYYCIYHCTIGMTGTIAVTTVGVEEISLPDLSVVAIGPNPSNGNMTLELQIQKDVTLNISLIDLKGMEVVQLADNIHYEPGEYNIVISGQNIDPGTYICRVIGEDEVINRKIIFY